MLLKTLLEALGTLLLIYMLIHEQDLIAFEQRTERKVRQAVNRIAYRAYWTVQDLKAIRRACKRQGITLRRFAVMLRQERKEVEVK